MKHFDILSAKRQLATQLSPPLLSSMHFMLLSMGPGGWIVWVGPFLWSYLSRNPKSALTYLWALGLQVVVDPAALVNIQKIEADLKLNS